MTTADSGGKLTFHGQDPIVASRVRFGTMAALGMAARSVALAALWRQATGEGQDISLDVRKALHRFCGFFEGRWETINGRPPSGGSLMTSPFFDIPFFRETRDGRHVIALVAVGNALAGVPSCGCAAETSDCPGHPAPFFFGGRESTFRLFDFKGNR
jgi:hypothetical protein